MMLNSQYNLILSDKIQIMGQRAPHNVQKACFVQSQTMTGSFFSTVARKCGGKDIH